MSLETIKFGLLLSFIPFSLIFLCLLIWWALVDISLREISGSRRVIWTIAVLAMPLVGPVAYNYLVRRHTGYKKGGAELGNLCNAVH